MLKKIFNFNSNHSFQKFSLFRLIFIKDAAKLNDFFLKNRVYDLKATHHLFLIAFFKFCIMMLMMVALVLFEYIFDFMDHHDIFSGVLLFVELLWISTTILIFLFLFWSGIYYYSLYFVGKSKVKKYVHEFENKEYKEYLLNFYNLVTVSEVVSIWSKKDLRRLYFNHQALAFDLVKRIHDEQAKIDKIADVQRQIIQHFQSKTKVEFRFSNFFNIFLYTTFAFFTVMLAMWISYHIQTDIPENTKIYKSVVEGSFWDVVGIVATVSILKMFSSYRNLIKSNSLFLENIAHKNQILQSFQIDNSEALMPQVNDLIALFSWTNSKQFIRLYSSMPLHIKRDISVLLDQYQSLLNDLSNNKKARRLILAFLYYFWYFDEIKST